MRSFNLNLVRGNVLVTGRSKGIGHFIVRAFLEQGVNVSFCARTVDEEFSTLQNGSASSKVIGTSVDIGDSSQIKAWVEKAAVELGPIDPVVANACPVNDQSTLEAWEKSFQADTLGLIALIEATVPHLEKWATDAKTTSIVVNSSLAGFESRYHIIGSPYTTFKRAQATITKHYTRQLAPKGIRINTIIPSVIKNPSITKAGGTIELSTFQTIMRDNPGLYNGMVGTIPLGRTGTQKTSRLPCSFYRVAWQAILQGLI